MAKIVLSTKDMQAITDYPTSHDIEWPNKVVYHSSGTKPLSLAMTYTRIKDFENCPRLYREKHLTWNHPFTDSAATLWGSKVHKAHEDYVLHNKDMPKDVQDKIGTGVADMLIERENNLYDQGKLKIPLFGEQQWAMDATGRYASWMSGRGVFMRGLADVGMASPKVLYLFDYKTGKDSYPDVKQFDILSLLAVAQPTLQSYTDVRSLLLFLEAKSVYPKQGPYRVDMTQGAAHVNQLAIWQKKALVIIDYYQRDYWPEKQSGLCRFCPDKTCPFNTNDK